MLIDFKIRGLFIWTDPYLPDLTRPLWGAAYRPGDYAKSVGTV